MGYSREYDFVLSGTTALLMHRDDIDFADELEAWRKDTGNRGKSKAGDDRSPTWTWQGYLYPDASGKICMPYELLMAALKTAGARIIWKKQKTFKEKTQSGLTARTEAFDFFCGPDMRQIRVSDLPNRDMKYTDQKAAVDKLGFSLFSKRAKVGTAKHIRVRPRFDMWEVRGRLMVVDEDITDEVLSQLFDLAGVGGIGDWRPSSKSPGPFGQFVAKVKAV